MSEAESEAPRLAALDGIVAAWKQGDVEGVLAHLAEDVEFIYAIGQRPLQGKAIVRKLLTALSDQQNDVRWRHVHRAIAGNVVFAEGIDDYVNGEGVRIQHPFVTVFEFEGDLVRRWRDYYDQATLQRLEKGEPLSEWAAPLVAEDRGVA